MVHYLRISQSDPLPAIAEFRPFKAVVIIGRAYSEDWQSAASKWLVDSGCLSMMAWGENCTSWDDAVDFAMLERFDFGEIPDDQFVMTTWHESEPLAEVLWFAQIAAHHSHVELHNTLIDVGPRDRREELVAAYEEATTSDGADGARHP